jgi:hypothetical protein
LFNADLLCRLTEIVVGLHEQHEVTDLPQFKSAERVQIHKALYRIHLGSYSSAQRLSITRMKQRLILATFDACCASVFYRLDSSKRVRMWCRGG